MIVLGVMEVHSPQMPFANYTLMVDRVPYAKTQIVFCLPHYDLNALCVSPFVFQMALNNGCAAFRSFVILELVLTLSMFSYHYHGKYDYNSPRNKSLLKAELRYNL